MWKTEYTGGVVDDKISRGLIPELALDWAKVKTKPETLWERIQMIREMGHVLERHKRTRNDTAKPEKNEGEKRQRAKRKGQRAPADTDKKPAGEADKPPTERKDKAVELKGMSEYYLP
jgi:hypothetical protein